METSIAYLNQLHGDLLDAATRERRGASAGGPRRRVPSGLIAAAVAVLALAGLVGVVAKNGGIIVGGSDDSGGSARPASGAATGAKGVDFDESGVALEETIGYLGDGEGADAGLTSRPVTAGQVRSELARVIRTGALTVVIPRDTFDGRFGDAVDIAEDHGGFVAESSSRERAGRLVLRVPADAFDETLRDLRGLGEVQVESLHGKDVTAEYVDLSARLKIAKARRGVLLDLMTEATTIEQTLRVQNALDETQLRIEEIQGQVRLLDDRTSLATIELDLREQGVAADTEPQSIPSAFERAIDGFLGTIGAIVIGLGYLLPLILIGLVGWFVVVRVRRRRGSS